jgi:hypothetical protein
MSVRGLDSQYGAIGSSASETQLCCDVKQTVRTLTHIANSRVELSQEGFARFRLRWLIESDTLELQPVERQRDFPSNSETDRRYKT